MKATLLIVASWTAVAIVAPNAQAGEKVVGHVKWGEQKEKGGLKAGEIEKQQIDKRPGRKPAEVVVVDRGKVADAITQLAQLDKPGVEWPGYMLRGKIRYENVDKPGFVEMWNYFADGSYYFSRTLGEFGPMGKIEGKSDWREIALPFSLQAPGQTEPIAGPNKLVVNLVLPGQGKVELGPLEIVQFTQDAAGAKSKQQGAWWTPTGAGMIGGGLGTMVGLCGAVVGVLAATSWGRRAIVPFAFACVAVGAALLLAGAAALVVGQPWWVSFPLVLVGLIAVGVMGGCIPIVRLQTRKLELLRMEALDVR